MLETSPQTVGNCLPRHQEPAYQTTGLQAVWGSQLRQEPPAEAGTGPAATAVELTCLAPELAGDAGGPAGWQPRPLPMYSGPASAAAWTPLRPRSHVPIPRHRRRHFRHHLQRRQCCVCTLHVACCQISLCCHHLQYQRKRNDRTCTCVLGCIHLRWEIVPEQGV